MGAEDGVWQGGACFANFLMGRCSRLPWRHFHLCSFFFIIIVIIIHMPLKEMLFKEGLGVSLHAVLHFASSEDVGDLYLVLPSCNMSLWN
jgi:hypothetical protein